MSKRPAPYRLVLLGGLVLSSCATAIPTNQKAPNMPSATPASGSTLSPRSLLTSLTDLIVETGRISDITPERLQVTMGQQVDRWSESHFGFSGAATAEWRYFLEVKLATAQGPVVHFMFTPSMSGTYPSAAPLCELDYDAIAARLTAAGFQHATAWGEHGRRLAEHFTRDGITAMLTVQIAGDSPAATEPRCVTAIHLR